MYTSQVELINAKDQLKDLIADSREAIGRTAVHHFMALEQQFPEGDITKGSAPYTAGRKVFRRTKFVHTLRDFDTKGARQDDDDFGLQNVETIAARRLFIAKKSGNLAMRQHGVNRAVRLHYGIDNLIPRHVVELTQQGDAFVKGFVTRPRREEGDLTTQTYTPDGFRGYQDVTDLVQDYSESYRGALSAALFVNSQLDPQNMMPTNNRAELMDIITDWERIHPNPPVSEGHILQHLRTSAQPWQ
jgi:hypothetical protein